MDEVYVVDKILASAHIPHKKSGLFENKIILMNSLIPITESLNLQHLSEFIDPHK